MLMCVCLVQTFLEFSFLELLHKILRHTEILCYMYENGQSINNKGVNASLQTDHLHEKQKIKSYEIQCST